jgi:alpha-maltose-1-phosphate synthase
VRIVVSNPSSNPETAHAASAFARRGRLARYRVPIAVARSLDRLDSLPLAPRLVRELRRRPLPSDVGPGSVESTAWVSDLARVAASRLRLPPAAQARLAEWHRIRFDRQVADGLRPGTDAVLAVQGSARATLERAREIGAQAILNATMPDPRLMQRLIDEDRRGAEVLPSQFAERRVAEVELADLVLVPSSFARDSYAAEGIDPAKFVVVPLGVDLAMFGPRARDGTGPFRVVFVGRLSRLKGVPLLLDAIRTAAIPDGQLVLVGDSSHAEPAWLRDPLVRHVSPLSRQGVAALLASADAFVMPTLADSFGLVLLEAMACGLPVIASAHSAAPDVVEDGRTGFVVPAGDSSAIAERLVELAADAELRARMGAEAAAAAAKWTWRAYEDRVAAAVGGA